MAIPLLPSTTVPIGTELSSLGFSPFHDKLCSTCPAPFSCSLYKVPGFLSIISVSLFSLKKKIM